ncbi:MAG: HAMP domain-containing histidine kinase [Pirellulales bacterium]|nr:HAMP domain-containing histidine kinase [Pirellulales bacterium]
MNVVDSTRKSLEALEQRIERLEEANRLKDEFLSALGHELGNVFLPYQFALQLLQHEPANAATFEQVRAMLEEHSGNVEWFMENLRTVSRIVRGKLQAERKPVDLKEIVEQGAGRVQSVIDKHRLRISVSLPLQPITLQGDSKLLGQMVEHLLQNAARFTDPGGHVWLSLARENGEAVLRVRDTGMGIAPELMPRLFTLFVQGDPLTGGWGAGLATVRTVAELHGGRVEAFSPGPRQGAEFVVYLPV